MMNPDKKILCVGLVCVDFVNIIDGYPQEDTDNRVSSCHWQAGGNATNSCCVLGLLGEKCEYFGTLANAPQLSVVKKSFDESGVEYGNCVVYNEEYTMPTTVIIVNSRNGSRTILHSNPNLPELTLENFQQLNLNEYKWIHFEGRPNCEEIRKMLLHIHQYNERVPERDRIKTSVECEKTKKPVLALIINMADYVFVSKDFAEEQGFHNMETAASGLLSRCRPGSSIICPWAEQGAAAKSWEGDVVTVSAFPPEKVVDTLAAGDTYIAATLSALCRQTTLREAVTYGCRIAGAKCGMVGYKGLANLRPSLSP